jgi:FkbM family methyltransferase
MTPPEQAERGFWTHLTSDLLNGCHRHERYNIDELRFGHPPLSLKTIVQNTILDLAASLGFYRGRTFATTKLKSILEIDGLEHAYELLRDQISKDLFVKLLAYRILGYRKVRLPLNHPKYWELQRSLDQYLEKGSTVTDVDASGSIGLCDFKGIRLRTHPLYILNTFLLEQYRCPRAGVGVNAGDVVIDAGGCWGDTALYFAQNAAKVFCFECMPSNIKILDENLGLNPALASKVGVIQKALWSRSGEKLVFKDTGAASRPTSNGHGVEVETQAIDDFASTNSLKRVDFIKMDIEGSEPEALIGATQTLQEYRPQLAICVYHDRVHLASIANWISSLNLGYRFWLDHFTIHLEETVLFARPDS